MPLNKETKNKTSGVIFLVDNIIKRMLLSIVYKQTFTYLSLSLSHSLTPSLSRYIYIYIYIYI